MLALAEPESAPNTVPAPMLTAVHTGRGDPHPVDVPVDAPGVRAADSHRRHLTEAATPPSRPAGVHAQFAHLLDQRLEGAHGEDGAGAAVLQLVKDLALLV